MFFNYLKKKKKKRAFIYIYTFPAPTGPTIATNCPDFTVMLMRFKVLLVWADFHLTETLVNFITESFGCAASSIFLSATFSSLKLERASSVTSASAVQISPVCLSFSSDNRKSYVTDNIP